MSSFAPSTVLTATVVIFTFCLIRALIVEAPDAQGPYGAKEAGEGPLHSSIPAIANAIYDAVGVRLDELPFTPERVLAALEAKREAERIEEELPLAAGK